MQWFYARDVFFAERQNLYNIYVAIILHGGEEYYGRRELTYDFSFLYLLLLFLF